ncbi:HTH domain-containing protein [Ferdinandcohnia quinoae]|uniref:Uncharacterized protein n=1 Tax=Fredinandcohnia quinoae TaxID=2918902 RepID=A0AAW5E5B0_9BACI|nr:HTH domain-containing protein [Fredinandcohnia sp. SECRCQ15]MCH1626729.1 hypothetical protein [Fredinandcohnia sp. SECRCQ15]
MDIKAGDPRDLLKTIIDEYKITPYSMSLISGIDEVKVLEYVNYDTDLCFLPVEKLLDFTDLILFLSVGMKDVTPDERVSSIIEHLNVSYNISFETLSIYANIEEKELRQFIDDYDSLSFEKRYRLGLVVLFLHFVLTKK